MVVDLDGKILFHSKPARQGERLADKGLLERVQETKEVRQKYLEGQTGYLGFVVPIFGTRNEHVGAVIIGYPADLISRKTQWCYSEATVPKLTLVTRKDYGGSYLAMCSRDLGADFVLAWPTAEIAVMGAEGAANVIFRKEINAAPYPAQRRQEIIAEYENLLYNPYIAASRGFVDQVIVPRQTRGRLIAALEVLSSKRENLPAKKHGNIPV